jgi:uncharacterized protein YjbI with pentapeptide repeats
MRQIKKWTRHIASAGLAAVLAACGGGGAPAFVPQFNVTERELYEPGRAEAGIVVQGGSGGVSLQLEVPNATGLPWGADTAALLPGTDRFYFDLLNDGFISLSMSSKMLQAVEAVELYDANGQRLWRVDAQNPVLEHAWLWRGSYATPVPRYEVRIHAAGTAVDTSQIIAWFGDGLVTTANRNDMAKLRAGAPVSCADCNLSGARLGEYRLEAAFLPGANLKNAWLVRLLDPAALTLEDFSLFKILWDGSQVAGAKMKAAYLAGVDFTGAIVTGAGHSPADFEAAHLYGAVFNGVNLDGVNMNAAFMDRAELNQASMVAAQLNNAQMVDTRFLGSNLRKAQFTKAMLTRTNFSQANLEGADFSNALIKDVNFTGAILSGAIWTDGVKVCATPSVGSCQ